MSLLKYIERLDRMNDLIRRKATGNPDEFAKKLQVSRSQLMQDLKELRDLGAPIEFCNASQSYWYTRECKVVLDFGSSKIYGGIWFTQFYYNNKNL
ncbi:MAG: HTH domain-containing protein [Flammeovirgaceae bacterium]|nr:HTH domain-containing protein [Flammeovirgaceae bacterium]